MTDFFDWLTAADSGLAADRLREQFRLSEEEMRRTSEALAPAFLLGLQRLAAQPAAWSDFMARMSGTGSAADGRRPRMGEFGDLLGPLFGSKALADSIARQASTMSGISPDTIAKMMPELGLMTVRTMMRMAGTPGSAPFGNALPSDAGGLAMAEMMRRSANAVEAFSRPSGSAAPSAPPSPHTYLEQLFSDALRGGFPWMTVPRAPGERSGAASGDKTVAASPFFAFAPLFDAFARGAAKGQERPATPQKETVGENRRSDDGSASGGAGDPLSGIHQALDAGRALQETYAREMLALFERHRRTD